MKLSNYIFKHLNTLLVSIIVTFALSKSGTTQMREIRSHHTYDSAQYFKKDINSRYQFFVSDFTNFVKSISQNPMISLLLISTAEAERRAFLADYSAKSSSLVDCASGLLPLMNDQAQSGQVPATFSQFEAAMRDDGSDLYLDNFFRFLANSCGIDDLSTLWASTTEFYDQSSSVDFYQLGNEPCTERFIIGDWYFSRSVVGKENEAVKFEDTIGIATSEFRLHFYLFGHMMGYDGGQVQIFLQNYSGHADAAEAAIRISGRDISPLPFEAFNGFGGGVYFQRGFAIPDVFSVLHGFRSGNKELDLHYSASLGGNPISDAQVSTSMTLPDAGNLLKKFTFMGERLVENVEAGSCDPLRGERSLLTGEVVGE